MIFKQIYLTHRWDSNRYDVRVRVDVRVIVIKRCATLPLSSELEPHHSMRFNVLPRAITVLAVDGSLILCRKFKQSSLSLTKKVVC